MSSMTGTSVTSAAPSRRTRIYLLEDVRKHRSSKDCWVVHDNKVYDVSLSVTAFLEDHPGGDDLILNYAGKDITSIMADPVEHEHSDSAYELLQQYQLGVIGAEERITNEDFVWNEKFEPQDTDTSQDWQKNQFLDLQRPLVMQMLRSDFSKSFYLQQVHQPRHMSEPATLFGPWYLEMLTRTSWYVVPIVWTPITLYFLHCAWMQQPVALDFSTRATRLGLSFLFGNFAWTILEYTLHRFLFHMEAVLPDHPFALTLHFLLHGIHHYLPMDRLRLVMPPILFAALSYPFIRLAHFIFPHNIAYGIIAGAYTFYIGYDLLHYFMHHAKLPRVLKAQKSWHMEHHYKEPNLGYGVTSPFWDMVFDTVFDAKARRMEGAKMNAEL
ncbi:BQ5605_C023g09716 [Microbotryum silenes-dioicae]|uniref:Ceramide very long chain fatty acid hydroxylase n=1 Tax=Microbotryum silenes-dioicae TaxID=796604 RepID=A0A2X0MLE8_9BASI|nr:BQ5605_C023g09716 [Microbotryum silenes-dioicae]